MLWGHLIPLSPFVPEGGDVGDECGDGQKDTTHTRREDESTSQSAVLKPLDVPGRFGREELLRPLSKICPACSSSSSRRRPGNGNSVSPAKTCASGDVGPDDALCNICQSVQSMARYIPREDFWSFSSDKENRLFLAISGNNAPRIVRVCSSGGDIRQMLNSQNKEGVHQMEVNDGDILSLLWYQQQKCGVEGVGNDSTSSELVPLVEFRLARIKEEGTAGVAVDGETEDNRVVVSILIDDADKDAAVENKNKENNVKVDFGGQLDEFNTADAKIDNNIEEEKKEDGANEQNMACDNRKEDSSSSSSSSSDDEHLWKAGGFLKAGAKKEEKVARGNYFRDIRAKYGDDRRDKKQNASCRPGTASQGSSKSLANCGNDNHIESAGIGSSKDEESELSSAPLTLPYAFLASCSKSSSFDSPEKSHSQSAQKRSLENVNGYVAGRDHSTPKKSNQSCKRTSDEMETTDVAKEGAAKTPKKSNMTTADAAKTNVTAADAAKTSVPISSLSYDQLVLLQKESMPLSSSSARQQQQPSLRHTVLSLTLALTSNASLWNSDFLRECNAEGSAKASGTEQIEPQHPMQKWMPRLLQGTQIKLPKKEA